MLVIRVYVIELQYYSLKLSLDKNLHEIKTFQFVIFENCSARSANQTSHLQVSEHLCEVEDFCYIVQIFANLFIVCYRCC